MQRQIRVAVLGAGGTGSEVLGGLARLDYALRATGHPGGLDVTVIDGDTVSPANLGRQPFAAGDVGLNKAVVLVQRYNIFYGLEWSAVPQEASAQALVNFILRQGVDILVTCVDRASVRHAIAIQGKSYHAHTLWLDTGNDATKAQVVLGHLSQHTDLPLRLPNVYDLYKELSDVDDDATPSCSVAEALTRQDLFINRFTADCAVQLLNVLLRHGSLDYHGVYIDLSPLSVQRLPIDPSAWEFLGYKTRGKRRRKAA